MPVYVFTHTHTHTLSLALSLLPLHTIPSVGVYLHSKLSLSFDLDASMEVSARDDIVASVDAGDSSALKYRSCFLLLDFIEDCADLHRWRIAERGERVG